MFLNKLSIIRSVGLYFLFNQFIFFEIGKRRKNELEDLQSWTVNYPVSGPGLSKSASERNKGPDERTWDDAIGSYSQVLGERVKRRKRMVRQGGNLDSDFVFEHDKDYPK